MNSFHNNRLRDHETPLSTVWLLNDIAESRGKQELFTRQSPQALKALRDTAVIQSAESSNRIEGVTVAPARLYPLVLGQAKPRDRSEQEIQDYRRALNEIHSTTPLFLSRRPPCNAYMLFANPLAVMRANSNESITTSWNSCPDRLRWFDSAA